MLTANPERGCSTKPIISSHHCSRRRSRSSILGKIMLIQAQGHKILNNLHHPLSEIKNHHSKNPKKANQYWALSWVFSMWISGVTFTESQKSQIAWRETLAVTSLRLSTTATYRNRLWKRAAPKLSTQPPANSLKHHNSLSPRQSWVAWSNTQIPWATSLKLRMCMAITKLRPTKPTKTYAHSSEALKTTKGIDM